MIKENVKTIKLVLGAFVVALLLGGAGVMIYFMNADENFSVKNEDMGSTLDSINTEVKNVDMGSENDGFVELDQEIQKLGN